MSVPFGWWQKGVIMLRLSCYYCTWTEAGQAGTLNFEGDHMDPVSRGGADASWNIVWACIWCNRQKGDKTAGEYIAWRWLNPQKATYGPYAG